MSLLFLVNFICCMSACSSTKEVTYYGLWRIEKTIGTLKIYALSEKEVKLYLGKEIFYSKKVATDGDYTCKDPIYKRIIETREDALRYGKLDLKKIGINTVSVINIDVYAKEGGLCPIIGASFYIKNNDTLIIGIDGVMFEMNRVSDKN